MHARRALLLGLSWLVLATVLPAEQGPGDWLGPSRRANELLVRTRQLKKNLLHHQARLQDGFDKVSEAAMASQRSHAESSRELARLAHSLADTCRKVGKEGEATASAALAERLEIAREVQGRGEMTLLVLRKLDDFAAVASEARDAAQSLVTGAEKLERRCDDVLKGAPPPTPVARRDRETGPPPPPRRRPPSESASKPRPRPAPAEPAKLSLDDEKILDRYELQ